jgi:hypothetical protein
MAEVREGESLTKAAGNSETIAEAVSLAKTVSSSCRLRDELEGTYRDKNMQYRKNA